MMSKSNLSSAISSLGVSINNGINVLHNVQTQMARIDMNNLPKNMLVDQELSKFSTYQPITPD